MDSAAKHCQTPVYESLSAEAVRLSISEALSGRRHFYPFINNFLWM